MSLMKESPNQKENINETAQKHDHEMNKILANTDIFVGTYDSYLLSYKIKTHNEQVVLQRVINQNSHTSSIRSIHGVGKFLASGGSDDRIVVLDLKKNQEIQMLTHHTGTVNQVKFSPDGSYLFSASDDGTLAATKTGSWKTDNVWKMPHSGKAIIQISIHPSGKLALTLGRDCTVRTWSLIKGRQCFTTNLKNITSKGETIEQVQWSPDGDMFSLIAIDKVLILSVGSAGIIREFKATYRVISLCWLNNNTIVLGQMNGKVQFVNVVGDKTRTVLAHENRVKDMALLNDYLITISSNTDGGELSVWHANADTMTLKKVCETNINRRPVCLTVMDASEWNNVKDEDEEVADELQDVPVKIPQNPLLTMGQVTIENNDDDTEIFQTPVRKENKKTKPTKSVQISGNKKNKKELKVTPKSTTYKKLVVEPPKSNKRKKDRLSHSIRTSDDEVVASKHKLKKNRLTL